VRTINIIGCGKVGRTLARLWTERSLLSVRGILNRSIPSGLRAVEFVGAGRAVEDCARMERADLVMIAAPDEAIEGCCGELCRSGVLGQGAVVFHCSGSLSSALLEPARRCGASVASVHPVKSFADPATAVKSFAGTFCGVEGDPAACEVLGELLRGCGAVTFSIEPEFKTIYHAGSVMVCNYFVALIEAGLRCFEKAGISRETALQVIEPIVRETVDNVFRLGPVGSLTGPIARGEPSVVGRQCEALGRWDGRIEGIYRSLGRLAVEISALAGGADADALAAIKELLDESP